MFDFTPSKTLCIWVRDATIKPEDEDVLSLIKDLGLDDLPEEEILDYVSNLISDSMYGIITNFAKRIHNGEKVKLVNGIIDGRFTPNICEEIRFALGLDPYDLRMIFFKLFSDFMSYLYLYGGTKETAWGIINLNFEKDDIEIFVNEEAFPVEDFSDFFKD